MVGEAARRASGLTVNLDRPDARIVVEVGPELAFVTTHVVAGPGGLPVGVSGNVLLLLSGGIDSPVAGYLCQKRGCRLTALYFHSAPYTGEPAKQKVVELAHELATLPPDRCVPAPARQTIAVGETYDFEVQVPPGRQNLWLEVRTTGGKWHAQGQVIVK